MFLSISYNLLPAMPPNLPDDQFAYRPTGNTAAALVTINHHVAKLLTRNPRVRCLSKALDSINHPILACKLAKVHLPDRLGLGLLIFFLLAPNKQKNTQSIAQALVRCCTRYTPQILRQQERTLSLLTTPTIPHSSRMYPDQLRAGHTEQT